jgi:hypothetical protein
LVKQPGNILGREQILHVLAYQFIGAAASHLQGHGVCKNNARALIGDDHTLIQQLQNVTDL